MSTIPASRTLPTSPAAPAPHGVAAPDRLRLILRIDSWGTAVFAVFLLAGAPWLSGPLGIPADWSVPFGVAMLGGAAALGLIAGYPVIPYRLGAAVVAGNVLSCAALLVLVLTGVLPLNGPGTAFMLFGAALVAVFAALQYGGWRGYGRAAGRG